MFQKSRSSLVVEFKLFGQVTGELSFGHTRSHEFLLQELTNLLVSMRILTHCAVEKKHFIQILCGSKKGTPAEWP
jgi:hypothetical protein